MQNLHNGQVKTLKKLEEKIVKKRREQVVTKRRFQVGEEVVTSLQKRTRVTRKAWWWFQRNCYSDRGEVNPRVIVKQCGLWLQGNCPFNVK